MAKAPIAAQADDEVIDDIETEEAETGGGYVPDAAAKAWHDNQVKGLKSAQSKALSKAKREQARAEEAEAALATAQGKLAALQGQLGDDAHEIGERLAKLREFEAGSLKSAGVNEGELLERGRKGAERKYEPQLTAKTEEIAALKAENKKLAEQVHDYKYTGTLKGALNGIVKPGYDRAALATLKEFARIEGDELVLTDPNTGEMAVDINGHPMQIGVYMTDVFRKSFADLCIKDQGVTVNGTGPGTKAGEKNPWMKDSLNRTRQVQISQTDPNRARVLIKAAGQDPKAYGL